IQQMRTKQKQIVPDLWQSGARRTSGLDGENEYPGISMALLMVPELHPVSDELHVHLEEVGYLQDLLWVVQYKDTMSWNPGAEKTLLSFLLLGIVDSHIVIENHKQEKRHARHIGEDSDLHIRAKGSEPERDTVAWYQDFREKSEDKERTVLEK
ncbi:hypothetical protein U0070_021847, partial [Myodes glareolus]